MAYPSTNRFNISHITCQTASIGTTPVATMLRIPFRCQLMKVSGVAFTSISAADCSVSIASYTSGAATAITTLTIPVAGADAGQVASLIPATATYLNEDDVLKFIPSGATGSGVIGNFSAILKSF